MDEKGKEDLGAVIKTLYERYEMLSRWTPELTAREFLAVLALREGDGRSVSWLASALGLPHELGELHGGRAGQEEGPGEEALQG